jgi:uncharacterized protein (TIGR00369 family)
MPHGKHAVGLDNHTSFIRATRTGTLHCRATPVTRGRRTQIWDVTVHNDARELAASGRVRLLVLDAGSQVAGEALTTQIDE